MACVRTESFQNTESSPREFWDLDAVGGNLQVPFGKAGLHYSRILIRAGVIFKEKGCAQEGKRRGSAGECK